MKYLLVAAAFLALTTPALACDQTGCGTHGRALWPPPQYDNYAGRLTVNIARDMDDLADLCSPHPLAHRVRGCSFRYVSTSGDGSVRCYVYIAPLEYLKQSGDTVEDILRHEKGHCAGWPGNHPREAAPPPIAPPPPQREAAPPPSQYASDSYVSDACAHHASTYASHFGAKVERETYRECVRRMQGGR